MSAKRKASTLGLNRRVRARREEEWDPEPEDVEASSSDGDVSEEDVAGEQDEEQDDMTSESGSEQSDASEPAETGKVNLSAVSFGALARAQASLPSLGKKSKEKDTQEPSSTEPSHEERRGERKYKSREELRRSSKHAPQEQSSKRPVSRKREIIADNRRQARDPRFDPMTGPPTDEYKARRAYAFLDEYRDQEMADLRAQIKKTKDVNVKEDLKRQLMSMESRKKAAKKKEEADALIREHRKKEKELVAQGKTPFYLKKSEQKKQLLVNRYASMSKGQVDKAIERKRKKVAGKEKKELDFLQRDRTR